MGAVASILKVRITLAAFPNESFTYTVMFCTSPVVTEIAVSLVVPFMHPFTVTLFVLFIEYQHELRADTSVAEKFRVKVVEL